MAHEVFISYSTEDKPVADAVVAGLEQKNIRCWIAPRDLLPGITWSDGISDAINKCKFLVVILSKNSNVSKHVIREINLAVNHELFIIPFRIDKIDPSGPLSYFIGSEHWLDAISPPLQQHIEKLGEVIQIFLSQSDQLRQSVIDSIETPPNFPKDKKKYSLERVLHKNLKVWLGSFVVLIVVSIVFIMFFLRQDNTFFESLKIPTEITRTLSNFEVVNSPTISSDVNLSLPSPSPSPPEQKEVFSETPILSITLDIGSTLINPVDDSVLVYIPAGTFVMGNEESDALKNDERPAINPYINAFWIQKYEVTNAQYQKCIKADVCEGQERDYPENNYPAVSVDWYDALLYCNWIGGRLPTEAEWEKAARGMDGRLYPWGNEPANNRLVNFNENSNGPEPVGSYPLGASPFGVLDMAGNVWEWVMDWYDPNSYSEMSHENRVGPSSGTFRVIRGGSWYTNARSIRVTNRYRQYPEFRDISFGFRCSMNE